MEGPPVLRTQRLLLRPFTTDDVDDVYAYASGPDWNRYLGLPEPYTRRSAEWFVATTILDDPATRLMWAIVHQERVVGGIHLEFDSPGAAELGYSLAQPLWGRGLTTEAALAVSRYGFEERELARLWTYADIRNEASWRVMEKIGMRREGVLRSRRILRGERVDDVFYAILREEWRSTESSPGR